MARGAGRLESRLTRGRAGVLLAAATGTALLVAAPGLASTSITTVAGGGTRIDDGAPATQASLKTPAGIRPVANGFVLAEQGRYRVRRVSIADIATEDTGSIETIAGSGSPGTGQAVLDGAATAVSMNLPCCLSSAANGDLFVADTLGGMIWRVAGNRIRTVAGTGSPSSCSPSPPAEIAAKSAPLCFVVGVGAAPAEDRFLIAEDGLPDQSRTGGARVYEVDPAGVLHIVAGGGCPNPAPTAGPLGICLANPRGPLFTGNPSAPTEFLVADRGRNVIWKVSSTSPATAAATLVAGTGRQTDADQSNLGDNAPAGQATLSGPADLAITPDRALIVADRDNCRVRRIAGLSSAATITTLAGTTCGANDERALAYPQGVAFAPGGILVSESVGGRIRLLQRTTITGGPLGDLTTRDATLSFESVQPQPQFQCSLDGHVSACSSPRLVTGLTDGPHTFSVFDATEPADPSPAVRTWTVDTTPPEPIALLGPDTGAVDAASEPQFAWEPSRDATTGVERYELIVDGQSSATVSPDGCAAVCTARPSAPLSEGGHTWRVRAVDGVGLVRDSETRRLAVGSDPVARLAVAPDPVLTGNPVGIDASASSDEGGPIADYKWDLDGDGIYEIDSGARPLLSRSFPLAGAVQITVRVTDRVGRTAIATRSLRVNDPPGAPRLYGVSVNEGALYTRSPDVTLALSYPGSTTGVVMSNDGGFMSALALEPSTRIRWRLASSGSERLPKTVYVRFLSGPFETDSFSDDIVLDETEPAVLGVTARVAGGKRIVRVRARDDLSGIAALQISVGARASRERFRPFTAAPTLVRGRGKIWVRVRDGAGNISAWRTVR